MTTATHTSFADRCRALREHAGWTQRQLADHINVATITVSKWEHAGAVPRGLQLQAFERAEAEIYGQEQGK